MQILYEIKYVCHETMGCTTPQLWLTLTVKLSSNQPEYLIFETSFLKFELANTLILLESVCFPDSYFNDCTEPLDKYVYRMKSDTVIQKIMQIFEVSAED